jgi:hypothetical protein
VGSGGEETVRQSSDANRDGVDQDGRPEGLAGPAAEEVLERTPWQRRPRGALELCAAGVELGFRVWNGGVLRAGDVLVPSDADVLCDLLSTLETMYEGPRLPKGVSLRFDVADDAVVCIDFTGKTDNADSCMTFYICDAYVPYTIARRPHASPPANVSSVARDAIEGLLHYLFRKPSFLGSRQNLWVENAGETAPQVPPGPFLGLLSPHGRADGHAPQTSAQNEAGYREPARWRIGLVSRDEADPEAPRSFRSHPRILLRRPFWEGQFETVERALRGLDGIVLLPTGAGKSLAYQLAALLRPGLCIVIDPIISLIDDQIDNLRFFGIDRCAAVPQSIPKEHLERREVGEVHVEVAVLVRAVKHNGITSWRPGRLRSGHAVAERIKVSRINDAIAVQVPGEQSR